MASRRDLYQSYQFMVQRVISGLVLRETDPAQTPLRRMGGAMFGSVMIAVLSLAVAGIIGVISPGGNTTWKTANKVIVEEGTGAQFVWLQSNDGNYALHPVPNLASGALLVGTPETVEVSHASLQDAPRGAKLGIQNAPNSIPPVDALTSGPWTLCSLPAETVSGDEVPNTALVVGKERSSGTAIGKGAVLVRDIEANTLHLVWNGRQYPIADEDAVLEGLSLRGAPQLEVGTAWLTALPAGQTISPLRPTGRGSASSAVPDGIVGEVRSVTTGSGVQNYLVLPDKIQAISEFDADITLADPTIVDTVYKGTTVKARPLAPAAAASAQRVELPKAELADPPRTVPKITNVNSPKSTVCASFASADPHADIAVEAYVEGAELAPATPKRTQDGAVLADRVLVTGGYGALVKSTQSPTTDKGALFLVTDDGKRYAIANDEALQALGLTEVTPIEMPASIVARIPSGGALDSESAKQAI